MRTSTELLFRASLVVKAVDSVFEMIGGLLLTMPTKIARYVLVLTQHEVFRHHHVLTGRLNDLADSVAMKASMGEALYLTVHGFAKVVLIVAIMCGKRWGYVGLIAVLSLFTVVELVHAVSAHEIVTGCLGLFDFVVVVLISKEYRDRFGSKPVEVPSIAPQTEP